MSGRRTVSSLLAITAIAAMLGAPSFGAELGPMAEPDRPRPRIGFGCAARPSPPRIPPLDEQDRIDAARAKRDRKRAARLAKAVRT